ncbi:MAG: hypothetical protein HC802_07275, partial [Caldilineaceae bacterium]|nr:hypothetical protein [Caldilineaceae bacterium]
PRRRDPGAWDSGLLDPGQSYRFVMEREGLFSYGDVENPGASATIIVDENAPRTLPTLDETKSVIYLPLVVR